MRSFLESLLWTVLVVINVDWYEVSAPGSKYQKMEYSRWLLEFIIVCAEELRENVVSMVLKSLIRFEAKPFARFQ